MAVATALLVRWVDGYLNVNDAGGVAAWGRKEGFLTLGNVPSAEEVARIAAAVLASQAAPRVATAMGIEPETGGGSEAYVDFVVGDTVTAPDEGGGTSVQRVVSLTVAEDENGEITVAPELNSSFQVQDEVLNRWLKRLINGTLKGASASASPVPPRSTTNA